MHMNFSERVYKICRRIPRGKVATYKQVAEMIGTKAYRAVGHALHRNPYSKVPCHRVISNSGRLHGFEHGMKKKRQLLEKEGVQVRKNKVDLQKYQLKHFLQG